MSGYLVATGVQEQEKRLLRSQAKSIRRLASHCLFVLIVALIFPNFFNYPYFTWGGFESVLSFWPMFLFGTAFSGVVSRFLLEPVSYTEKRKAFGYGLLTSVLAGFWEEIGYRCVYICVAMISIAVVNWIFGAGLGWALTVALTLTTLYCLTQKEFLLALFAAAGAAASIWFAQNVNLVYWFYEYILVTIIHFTTFFQMDPVLYGNHDKLFLFGAILANTWFRNGHKYQGPIGFVISWYSGMVLLYAMVTYGLFTAIVVHALYDVVHDVMKFVLRPAE